MEKSRKPTPQPSAPRVRRARRKPHDDAVPHAGSPSTAPLAATSPTATAGELGASSEPRYPALLTHEHPLALCAVNSGYAMLGLAVLFVARRIGACVVCGHFVVDLLASGVTECYGEAFDREGFRDYVDEMDGRLQLESCDDATAAAILAAGLGRCRANRVAPPESLEHWARLLPPVTMDAAAAEALVFGETGRPMALGEMFPAIHRREARAALRTSGEPLCVVHRPSPLEH